MLYKLCNGPRKQDAVLLLFHSRKLKHDDSKVLAWVNQRGTIDKCYLQKFLGWKNVNWRQTSSRNLTGFDSLTIWKDCLKVTGLYNSDQLEYLPGKWEKTVRTSWTLKCFPAWIFMGKRQLDCSPQILSRAILFKVLWGTEGNLASLPSLTSYH